MANTGTTSEKLWIAFGVITIVCGVLLALEEPLIGVPGTIVGVWLIVSNVQNIRSRNQL